MNCFSQASAIHTDPFDGAYLLTVQRQQPSCPESTFKAWMQSLKQAATSCWAGSKELVQKALVASLTLPPGHAACILEGFVELLSRPGKSKPGTGPACGMWHWWAAQQGQRNSEHNPITANLQWHTRACGPQLECCRVQSRTSPRGC